MARYNIFIFYIYTYIMIHNTHRLLLTQRSLNVISIFFLIIRIFANVTLQVIKIALKKPIIPTRKANMYFNRLVPTKQLKYMLAFLVATVFSF